MLVVISVLIILVALSGGAYSRMMKVSDQARCVTNLQQIGMAIQAYASDHDQTLPGPLYVNQKVIYKSSDNGQLLWYIATYLGYPAPQSQYQTADIMYCPAWLKVAPARDNPMGTPYSVCLYDQNLVRLAPFGYPNQVAPKRLVAIPDPVMTPAVQDIDLDSKMPPTLSHGDRRNVLYFDWHVSSTTPDQF